MNNRNISVLLLFSFILCSFSSCKKDTCQKVPTVPFRENTCKPIVDVYMENSGSMYGYVSGTTEFEQSVYSYLSDISIKSTDSLNLNYINSKIIPQQTSSHVKNKIEDFIRKLDPSTFKVAGGNGGVTDITEMLKTIIERTDSNKVSIFVSDCIFSPGRHDDASEYLVNQQIGIKKAVADKLKADNEFCIVAYRLNARFNGWYYNREDSRTRIDDTRPFYILLLGDVENVQAITKRIDSQNIKGSGVLNSFSINSKKELVNYSIQSSPKIGDFEKCLHNSTAHIVNAKKSSRGAKSGQFGFAVNVDFSRITAENDYFLNPDNYELSNKGYTVSIQPLQNEGKYTHQLFFTLNPNIKTVNKNVLKVGLKKSLPSWVSVYNDEIGLDIKSEGAMDKTFGIKNLFEGIYEGFTTIDNSNKYFTELTIYIN